MLAAALARLTCAARTPGIAVRDFSTAGGQCGQVIPPTDKSTCSVGPLDEAREAVSCITGLWATTGRASFMRISFVAAVRGNAQRPTGRALEKCGEREFV